MASRMEKYYNRNHKSRLNSRTQKNRLLYQDNNEVAFSTLHKDDEVDIARLEKVLKLYEEKKQATEQQRVFVKLSEEESETVKNLVDAITNTSRLDNLNHELEEFTKAEIIKPKEEVKIQEINPLVGELITLKEEEPILLPEIEKKPPKPVSKKLNELEELNDFLDSYDGGMTTKERKSNKRLKIFVGFLFLITTIAIFYLIYMDIK